MAEFPSLPLFTDALVADTQHLTDEEFGAYIRLLILEWRTANCKIPADANWHMRKLGVDSAKYKKLQAPLLDEFFTRDGNYIYQRRLLKEYTYLIEQRKKQSGAAKSLWRKKKASCQSDASGINPAYTPHPTPPTPPIDDDAVSAFQKVFDAGCALFPNLMTSNTSSIHKWINAGCSIELDILPELNRTKARNVSSWNYFSNAIMDAKATRETPLPKGTPHEPNRTPKKSTIDILREGTALARAQREHARAEQT